MRKELKKFKIQPTFISFNPFKDRIAIKVNMHKFEKRLRQQDRGRETASFTLLTYGLDINISCQEFDNNDVLNAVLKLNFYTPFIIPFSFSSPFFKGKLWKGQSIRCFKRLKLRPAAIGFVKNENLIKKFRNNWILNKIRLPKEKGRIEYKAIDTIQDLKIYKGLIILLKGIILSNNLNEKSLTVNQELVEKSCIFGFHHKIIYEGCQEIICQAQKSLKNKEEKLYLDYLWSMLKSKNNLSVILKKEFKKLKSINKVLLRHSNFIR